MYQTQFPADGIQLLNKQKKKTKNKKTVLSRSLYFNGVTQKIINYQVVINGENKAKGCAPDGTDLYFSWVVN